MRFAVSAGLRAAVLSLAASVAPATLAAQQNPFAITAGAVTSAHLVYAVMENGRPANSRMEMILTKDQWVFRMGSLVTIEGKTDSAITYMKMTRDSVYRWSTVGKARPLGEVVPSVRGMLASSFEALDAAGKRRVIENLRTIADGGTDLDFATLALGEPQGSATYAGQRCDQYKQRNEVACVVPGTNHVMLFWSKDAMSYTATSVKLNVPIPPATLAPPAGVRFRPSREYDESELQSILELAGLSEPPATPAAAARAAVRFLASPEAAAKLREMSGEQAGDD